MNHIQMSFMYMQEYEIALYDCEYECNSCNIFGSNGSALVNISNVSAPVNLILIFFFVFLKLPTLSYFQSQILSRC